MYSATIKSGFVLLALLVVCAPGWGGQQKLDTPTCDVRLDLQYELQRATRVTLAGQMEVAPPVVKFIMSAAGEDHWNEVTKHGKKYPGICRDDEHPYYVLVWEVTAYEAPSGNVLTTATASLDALDDGCLVFPSVFSSVSIHANKEKAIKKVFEDTLRFLAENGKQPMPSPLYCIQPEQLGGPFGITKYKLRTLTDICKEHRPTYAKACGSLTERAAAPSEPSQFTTIEPGSEEGKVIVGTGFFASEHGWILTNAHVVSGCKQIQTRDGRTASLVTKDEKIDLALLSVRGESPAVARFRLQPAPRVGDSVVAFGFPLQGILSSGGNLTTGTIAAETGIGDDPRFFQISAPVQPGSSGSPLLDSSGDVVGIVEAKLDAVETLRVAGDIPQNVNFAIRASEAAKFLESIGIAYYADKAALTFDVKVADIAAAAKKFSVPIVCVQ
jgi:S1-C subfamily serine protease